MQRTRRLAWLVPGALGVLIVLAGLGMDPVSSRSAPPAIDPHGTSTSDTDLCVTCHSPHDAAGADGILTAGSEVEACYSCHDGTGAATNVKADFGQDLAGPRTSAHPVPDGDLTCSDCHTPHKTTSDSTALLRVNDGSGGYLSSPPTAPIGNVFCYACHGVGSTLPLPNGDHEAFETSVHGTDASIPLPASGSEIRCLACHESHGSDQRGLTATDLEGEELCLSCHTSTDPNTSGGTNPPWPEAVPGSDIVQAFTARANDYSTTDGDGIRIFHHPIDAAEQEGGLRRVECASCHNSHIADTTDTDTTSKIADPRAVLSMGSRWIIGWNTALGYMNSGATMTAYCGTCHQGPTTTAPISAGSTVPVDVRLVEDTALDADARPHDTFRMDEWLADSPHSDTLTCTACHDFHGSTNASMLRENIDAWDSTATGSITGFDALNTPADIQKLQGMCLTCHPTLGTDHGNTELCTTCHFHTSGKL
jgi:predicted CXXCH cytochrome family protein